MSNSPVAEKTRGSFAQLTRYAFVGIVSNSAGYVVYLLVTYLGSTPKLTMTLLYGVGAAVGYIGNRNLTFAHRGNVFGSGIRYLMAHCFGYCINLAILIIFVDKYRYAHQWVQAISIFIVAGFLFIAFKFFVFRVPNASNVGRL
jgi:putative flippase GtrA